MRLLFFILLLLSYLGYGQTYPNIIIGDSQTPYVDSHSKKVKKCVGLWKGGINVPVLIKMVQNHPISPEVKNVVICIGTNDRYNDLGVKQLVNLICVKFPNSKLYVVQGSWGWGGIKRITYPKVKKYYKIFEQLGVTIIKTPIGKREPHQDCPTYKQIGTEIDSLLYL
jgi:hypothetical protein